MDGQTDRPTDRQIDMEAPLLELLELLCVTIFEGLLLVQRAFGATGYPGLVYKVAYRSYRNNNMVGGILLTLEVHLKNYIILKKFNILCHSFQNARKPFIIEIQAVS